MLKCCCLPEKLGKHIKFITLFVYTINKIPTIFQTWSLTHRQNLCMLIAFFHPEGTFWNSFVVMGRGVEVGFRGTSGIGRGWEEIPSVMEVCDIFYTRS